MTEKPIVEVSYGDIRLTTASPTPKTRRAEIAEWVVFLRTALINLAIVGLVALVVAVIVKEVFRRPVIVEAIALPESLTAQGYTGDVIAHRLWDAVLDVQNRAETLKTTRAALTTTSRQLDVVNPATGISLQSVAQMIRSFLGINLTHISGEVLCPDNRCRTDQLSLRLRIITGDKVRIVSAGPLAGRDLQTYFDQSALLVLKEIDPYVAAIHFYSNDNDPGEARRIAERILREDQSSGAASGKLAGFLAGDQSSAPWAANLLGLIAADQGDMDAAAGYFRQSIELAEEYDTPNFALPHSNWGAALLAEDEYEQAVAQFSTALELDPQATDVQIAWGTALARWGDLSGAERKFEAALAQDPYSLEAQISWGTALAEAGYFADAAERFAQAAVLDPYAPEALAAWGDALYMQDLYGEAAEKFAQAARLADDRAKSDGPAGSMLVGLRRGRKKGASETLRKAEEPLSSPSYAWVGWGDALYMQDQYENAREKYQHAVEMEPGNSAALTSLADVQGRLGQTDAALAAYARVAEMDPGNSYALFAWGNLLDSLERYDEAAEKYRRATEIDTENADLFTFLGSALAKLEQYDVAEASFERSAYLAPEDAYLHFAWGGALEAQEKYDEAAEHYEIALRLAPQNGTYAAFLGDALQAQDKYDEAEMAYGRAVELAPDEAWNWIRWGDALSGLGRHDAALGKYRQAAELNPDEPAMWDYWALELDNAAISQDGLTCARFLELVEEFQDAAGIRAPGWFEGAATEWRAGCE